MPSRSDMIAAVTQYCRNNNIHISYLYKSSKKELEDFIIKYNINVEELLFELDKERESKTQESKAKFVDAINVIKGEMDMLMLLLTDEQKEKFFLYRDSQNSI
uniref:NET domain-containing protein n=1 Tax=viral metagenome TaxID=1070528 RepID=A0A6C0KPU3_9ZZZZ